MLFKKELQAVPLQSTPKIRGSLYTATAEILELPRSGKVLILDMFFEKELKLRFASDGKSYQLTTKWPANEGDWTQHIPHCEIGSHSAASTEATEKLVKSFLKSHSGWYISGVMGYLDSFCQEYHAKARRRADERKAEIMRRHFDMYPAFPSDLPEYCDSNIFNRGLIFIDTVKDGKRKALCADCGAAFAVDRAARSGQEAECPCCKRLSRYRGSWFAADVVEKGKLCVCHNVAGQLLIRWINVTRTYSHSGERDKLYNFEDYAYNLHIYALNGPKTYFYKMMPIPYTGYWDWYRGNIGDYCYDSTYVYTNNLREVFGSNYYHVDLQSGLAGRKVKIPFAILLNNLKNIPLTEYLFKLNLPVLAAAADKMAKPNGEANFQTVLGINKQLLPMYRKMNISIYEHYTIKQYGKFVTEENILQFRKLGISPYDIDRARRLLKTMSFDKFCHYFTKQKGINRKRNIAYLMTCYEDYLSMSEGLNVDLSHKSVRFPSNCVEAHDRITARFNADKHQAEDTLFVAKAFPLYEEYGLRDYSKDGFCAILPRSRTALLAEGQTLNHCVGGDNYFKNHISGSRMIFFIRKANTPEKPFFTMELDMSDFRICQLYGFGDCSAPKEVRKFAEEFAKYVSRAKLVAAS